MYVRAEIKFRIRYEELDPFLTELSNRSARSAAAKIRDRAREFAPVRTGAGRQSIGFRKEESGPGGTSYRIAPRRRYMTYQEFGTGPIVAGPGRVLAFQAGGTFVFAKRTRGVPAVHFMRRAYELLREGDFKPGPDL